MDRPRPKFVVSEEVSVVSLAGRPPIPRTEIVGREYVVEQQWYEVDGYYTGWVYQIAESAGTNRWSQEQQLHKIPDAGTSWDEFVEGIRGTITEGAGSE